MRQVAQSIYMAGVLAGAFMLGSLSDRFGRKAILSSSCLTMAASGTCAAFLPSFVTYCVFRYLCGMAFSGIVLNTISLCLEWTAPRGRTLVGTLFAYGFTCGQLVLAGIAYGVRDWRWLQFSVSAPYYIFFLTSCCVPESARWLIMNGRSHQALRNLQRVARINGKAEEGKKLSEKVLVSHMQSELSSVNRAHSPLDLVRTAGMRKVTVCLMLVWFSTSFAFYGLGMDLQNFGVNIFLLQFIFGAIDLPSKLAGAILMSYTGRRVTQAASLILAGVALLCNAFVPQDVKMARQSGLGVVGMKARAGSMVAPLVLMLSEISPIFPPAIYGIAAIISGTAATFLNETSNQQLPDTIEEVEARSKKELQKVIYKEEVPLTQNQKQHLVQKRHLIDTV
ncbi:solute carrier family 22 member 6-A-like [Dendrobates tinctorius]|uniref:solute carrier family 22 member 6-A-like n=1 Tax=Dendrobates tinctorius TaxID=92724 RepID=UPI003CC93BE4